MLLIAGVMIYLLLGLIALVTAVPQIVLWLPGLVAL